jgi:hypothetical protein
MTHQQKKCGFCHRDITTKPFMVMECQHNLHGSCAAELILASRFRCMICRPNVPLTLAHVIDTGCDAKHTAQVALALRNERVDEVRRLRAKLPTSAVARGALQNGN